MSYNEIVSKAKEIFRSKYFGYVFWGIIAVLLFLKFVLITNFGDEDFLRTYKFFSADSYDWIANGVRLFQNDDITFRPPGLPILIKILYSLKILFLLPLVNQVIFFLILLMVFKLTGLFTKKDYIQYFVVMYSFLNYGLQSFANYILADYYTILLITISLYVLLKGRYGRAFVFLGISLLFQNFPFFLFPIWYAFVVYSKYILPLKGEKYESLFTSSSFLKILKDSVLYFLMFINVNIFWYLYKYLKFGNPIYSKLDYFSLIEPNLNSLFFYSINTYTLFGILALIAFGYIAFNIKKFLKTDRILLLAGTFITCFFWIIIYDWNDRRFLLYLIPFLFPIIAIVLDYVIKKINVKYLAVLLISLYPSFLSNSHFFNFTSVPVTPDKSLVFEVHVDERSKGSISFPLHLIKTTDDSRKLVTILNPTCIELFQNSTYYRQDMGNYYSTYSTWINENQEKIDEDRCIEIEEYSSFQMNSILLITQNKTTEDVEIRFDCP